MAEKNRFSKPVAFNSRNEKDVELLEYVRRMNFSGYVKRLIREDMERKKLAQQIQAQMNAQMKGENIRTKLP